MFRTKLGKLRTPRFHSGATSVIQSRRQRRYHTVRPCNCYIVAIVMLVARYLIIINHARHNPQEGDTMNDRINYSGLVELISNIHDEPEPDLREWPVIKSEKPVSPQRDGSRLNNVASEG